ncbi:MAG: potassium transporter TrkG [[Eubacterium] siraeum]
MGHRIKRDAIYKTFTVIVLSLALIAVSFTGILMCCEGMSLQKTIFEVVSAFSTTGFSVGASAEMNVPAKLIMVFTMLAGRIGPVTLMTSLIIRKNHNSDKNRILPEGNILVG